VTPYPATDVRSRLIAPEVLARLANLELIARTAVEGSLVGLHRSPAFGFSQEFAEYRSYTPGDDLRYIDWNVYARADKTVVKRFFGDTNCRLMIMLDVSLSMDARAQQLPARQKSVISKLDYARFFAASLTYLAARQHDGVGLLAFNEDIQIYRPPVTRPAGVRALYHELDTLSCSGGTDWQLALDYVQGRLKKRSLVALISDFYTEPDDLATILRRLSATGHDLLLVHVLDPNERHVKLPFSTTIKGATLKDAETGHVMEVTPQELATAYPARLQNHLQAIKNHVLGMGGHYLQIDTDEPLDRAIAGYLRFRARHH
jgi:uncharacterized protein (DUF58 family)